jgi:hypothetical protein
VWRRRVVRPPGILAAFFLEWVGGVRPFGRADACLVIALVARSGDHVRQRHLFSSRVQRFVDGRQVTAPVRRLERNAHAPGDPAPE